MNEDAKSKERLQKLLLIILSSDKPGEQEAAREALFRTLAKLGMDHHDLSALIVGHLSITVQPDSHPPPRGDEKPADDEGHIRLANWILQWDEKVPGLLGPKEWKFCDDMTRWLKATDKQRAWLLKIAKRVKANLELRGYKP